VHIHAVFSHACLAAAQACRRHKVPYVVRPLGTLDPWSLRQKPFRKRLFIWRARTRQWVPLAERVAALASRLPEAAGAEVLDFARFLSARTARLPQKEFPPVEG